MNLDSVELIKFKEKFKEAEGKKCDVQTILMCQNGLGYLVPVDDLVAQYKYLLSTMDSRSNDLRKALNDSLDIEIDDEIEKELKNSCV